MSKFLRSLLAKSEGITSAASAPASLAASAAASTASTPSNTSHKPESLVKSLLMPLPLIPPSPSEILVDDPSQQPVVLLPSDSFKQRILNANDSWQQEFLVPFVSRHHPHARVHIYGTSLVNLPRLEAVPFSHNKKLIYEGQRALNSLLELYQTSGIDTTTSAAVNIGDRSLSSTSHTTLPDHAAFSNTHSLSILVNESQSQGAWLMEDYAPLFQPFFENEYVDKSIGGGLVSVRRPATTTDDRFSLVKAWSRQRDATFALIDTPSEWVHVLQQTGLIPQWDLTSFLSSVIEYRTEYVEDPVLREISPRVISMDLVGLAEEELNSVADESAHSAGMKQLEQQLQRWRLSRKLRLEKNSEELTGIDSIELNNDDPSMTLEESVKQRLARVYALAGVQPDEVGMITTGDILIDGVVQRLVLDPEGVRSYLNVLAEDPSMRSLRSVGITRRLAQTLESADNLERAIDEHLMSLGDDGRGQIVVVIADRTVAAILQSNLDIAT
ncbi:hypothetical protein BSLG_004388 [Batrachochytrium salamandrivorans]|nr:hypothetical protein BASA83_004889 [Batrachochytrium salamandrivorans]KAJ1340915.1 hypothetical protein BSLG_004388 [Batrachochytrium salamandrivorans]